MALNKSLISKNSEDIQTIKANVETVKADVEIIKSAVNDMELL